MTIKGNLSGNLNLATAGKKLITRYMYQRGRQFLFAALLLNEKIGKDYVYLHLICQGVEITLKSALLFKDYDKYKAKLIKPLGHDLEKTLKEYLSEYGIKRIDKRIISEISDLNLFYKKHRLRYATTIDILIDPGSLKSKWTIKFISRLIKYFDKKFQLVSNI